MATNINKAFTSVEQSKILSKILPIESADMCYIKHASSDNPTWRFDNDIPPMILGNVPINEIIGETLPCWSLDALLAIIAKQNFTIKSSYIDECEYNIDIPCRHCKIWFSSLLDAAFEMIVWLKENKKL